ncbi:MAG: beta-ketoacyl-[acyl-carrier-protein] synthase family protein [Bryobacteraceae bacterium]
MVTGIGVVTPVGTGRDQFWKALLAGECGIRKVRAFDTSGYAASLGAEVLDFEAAPFFERTDPTTMGRASHLAVAAARLAMRDSGLAAAALDTVRTGVSMGTTSGEAEFIEQFNDIRKQTGDENIAGKVLVKYASHRIPRNVAAEFGLLGPCLTIPTACAAGNFAMGYALDTIRTGGAERMLAGGADMFSRIPYSGFARLGAIAPERCQPFDRNRKGMVPGEGAAVMLLERLDLALARGAKIYAEILGYGVSCDAHHMTAAHPEGEGAIRAMRAAMKESGVGIEDIEYISAHGTGTPTNDRIEAIAAKSLFGERSERIPMSSIKSMIGHTMGAASAIETAACSLALDTGWVPPTINHEAPDDDVKLDFVPNKARQVHPKVVLNNAYAFGGNNASVCLGRYQ